MGVDPLILRAGPILQETHRRNLIKEVTFEEVKSGIHAINSNSAPGVNGFNSFFKKVWNILGKDVYNTVRHFFDTKYLYLPVNCTNITLLSKTLHVSSIKQYRPISCCTMLYKIIAKVLTDRM